MHGKLLQSYWTLCDPTNCSLPGSSVRFPRKEYWSGLPFPPPGDLSDPGIEPGSLMPPALASRLFTLVPPGKPYIYMENIYVSLVRNIREGNGTPLQCSCLENPVDGGAW